MGDAKPETEPGGLAPTGGVDETDSPATVDIGPGSGSQPDAPPAPRSTFDPPPQRFETVGELGRGGMGRVDDAIDRALGRPVAIKHMLHGSATDLARFEREARITALLEHPGIVPIHDVGRGRDGTPYYVMRRVDGQPLADLVAKQATLSSRLALVPNVLVACDAAAFAHARGIVHRDIKPANILVGPFGETLLIDWGLAREIGEHASDAAAIAPSERDLTRAGTVAGTPGFMAPEQARGETVDARADVFALGATLFYVLAGKAPYASSSATEMIGLAGAGRAPDWSALPPQVPADLRAIVEKAMASDSAARYRDAGELAADLRGFTLGNLVGAYRYGALARLARYVRRHRAAVAVAAVSAVVLAAVAFLSVRRIVAERDDANAAREIAEARQREASAAADRLLLEHAQELLDKDPVYAIQLLRQLRPESAMWPQAATVAQAAALRGIPIGFAGEPSEVPKFSPDGRRIALLAPLRGDLSLVDPQMRTRRSLANVEGTRSLAWLDREHVLVGTRTGIVAIDVTTGAQRSRDLQRATDQISIGRDGTLWLQGSAGLVRLASFDAPIETITNVTTYLSPHGELHATVVGGTLSVVSATRTWTLPYASDGPMPLVQDDAVMLLGKSGVQAWEIEGDQLQPVATYTGLALTARVHKHFLLAAALDGLHGVGQKSSVVFNSAICGAMASSASGERLAIACEDGTIQIFDRYSRWLLPARHTRYLRLEFSPDGRTLAAIEAGGTLLVWDLTSFAPLVRGIEQSEEMIGASRQFVWVRHEDGIVTYDRTSWQREVAVSDMRMAPVLVGADPSGKVVWMNMLGMSAPNLDLLLFDSTTGKQLRRIGGEENAGYAITDRGFVVGYGDGRIVEWAYDASGVVDRDLGRVDGKPITVHARGNDVAIALADPRLAHVDRGTGVIVYVALPKPAQLVGVDIDGSILAASDGELWRWRLGAPPQRVTTPGEVRGFAWTLHGIAVRCANAIVVPSHDPPFVLVFPGDPTRDDSVFAPSHESDWLVALGTHDELLLASVTSGTTFALHYGERPVHVLNTGNEIYAEILGEHPSIYMWSLGVPTEPAALRRWLADVTNARSIEGSEAIVWP